MGVDLGTSYLGLRLKNPLVVAACPLTANTDSLCRLEECGAAAAVLPSLFAEQIEHDEQQAARLHDAHSDSFAEAASYLPRIPDSALGPSGYLDHVEHCKRAVSMPIIASLNGSSVGNWTGYAERMQNAGADALELNIHFVPTSPDQSAAEVEQRYVDLVAAVRQSVTIPLAVKIGPYFSSLPHVAHRLVEAGCQGLVLFNRYLEPDIDLESLQLAPDLVLSDRFELRLAMRWIATLRDQLDVSMAATSGAHFCEDVLKALLVGADVVMMAAAVLRYGPVWLRTVLKELRFWLEKKEYTGVEQLKGSMSLQNCPNPTAFHRVNYMRAVASYTSHLI